MLDKLNLELAIFDMDGLMFDTEMLHYTSWQALASKYGFSLKEEFYRELIGTSDSHTRGRFLENFGDDFKYDEYILELLDIIDDKIDTQGIPIKKGLFEMLDFLESLNIKKALASSSKRATIEKFLKLTNLTSRFDFYIGGNEVENTKPNPEIYMKICSASRVNPENVIVFEDSVVGLTAAYNAGLKCIVIPDILQPTEDDLKMAYSKATTLLDAIEIIKTAL